MVRAAVKYTDWFLNLKNQITAEEGWVLLFGLDFAFAVK